MGDDLARREFLKRSTAYAIVVVGSGGLLAACAAPGSSAGTPGGASPGGSASSAGPETTWQRIQREKKVRIGVANEPPFGQLDASGNVTGQAPELLAAALQPYGITTFEGVLTEFGALIPSLLAGRIDVITAGMFVRPARCEQISFGEPDGTSGELMIVKSGNPLNLHSFEDVAKSDTARFAITRGAVEQDLADVAGIPKDRQVVLPDNQSCLAALQADRVDAMANTTTLVAELMKNANDPNLELAEPFADPIDKDGMPARGYAAMGFRREDLDFIEAYNVELSKLIANGGLREINAKWDLPVEYDVGPDAPSTAEICVSA